MIPISYPNEHTLEETKKMIDQLNRSLQEIVKIAKEKKRITNISAPTYYV